VTNAWNGKVAPTIEKGEKGEKHRGRRGKKYYVMRGTKTIPYEKNDEHYEKHDEHYENESTGKRISSIP
jgi:hypothetical protein